MIENMQQKDNREMKKILILAALPLALAGLQANAATISYYLDQSNALPDGINYAQVTISDGVEGNIDFTVDVLTSAFTVTGSNFGMQNFSFNHDDSLTVGISNISDIDPSTIQHG